MVSLAIEQFRSTYLADPDIQNRIKNKTDSSGNSTTDIFLSEAIEVAKEKGLLLWTQYESEGAQQKDKAIKELREAIELYAQTGEGATDACPTKPENTPPFTPPTLERVLEIVRDTDDEICSW